VPKQGKTVLVQSVAGYGISSGAKEVLEICFYGADGTSWKRTGDGDELFGQVISFNLQITC
jgi:hypothetical protein